MNLLDPIARALAARGWRQATLSRLNDNVVRIGDSLARYDWETPQSIPVTITNVSAASDLGMMTWVNKLSGGRWTYPPENDLGISGTTSEQIKATIDAALALIPTTLVIGGLSNDFAAGISKETSVANKLFCARKALAAGVFVVVEPHPPRQTWGGIADALIPIAKAARVYENRMLRAFCEDQMSGRAVFLDYDDFMCRQDIIAGTLSAGGTTTVTLPTGITKADGTALTDDYFKYWLLRLRNSSTFGQSRLVTSYNASTRVATLLGTSWPTTGSIALTAAATANTLTRNDGKSFYADGFDIGAAITISGMPTGANNGGGSILDMTDSVMTVSRSLTSESGTGTVIVTTPTSATLFWLDPDGLARDDVVNDGLHNMPKTAIGKARKFLAVPALGNVPPKSNIITGRGSKFEAYPSRGDNLLGNLLINGRMMGTGPTISAPFSGSGVAPGWTPGVGAAYSSTKTIALSKEIQANGSEKQVIALSALTGGATNETYYLRQVIPPGLLRKLIGKRLQLTGLLDVSNVNFINQVSLFFTFPIDGAGNTYTIQNGRNQKHIGDGMLNMFPTDPIPEQLFYDTPTFILPDPGLTGNAVAYVQWDFRTNASGAAGSLTAKIAATDLHIVP